MRVSDVSCLALPDWTATDLMAALPPGATALLDGVTHERRHCTLVAWAPTQRFSSIDAAAARLCPAAGVPNLLSAAVGALDWDGTAHFWIPGGAALFDPGAGRLWVRGDWPRDIVPGSGSAEAPPPSPTTATAAWDFDQYAAAVAQAKEHIECGALAKVILSVPFTVPTSQSPLQVYQRLVEGDPPGLRFLLQTDEGDALLGASPEPLVLLTGRRAELHLLAGTRRAEIDLTTDLLTSSKDRIEHLVAVEQARRDLLTVCTANSVCVEALFTIERHPGLIHLASHLAGTIGDGVTPGAVVAACFPASTVAGVPRQSAIDLIDRLEPTPRDWYAGAVGAVLPNGDLQLWLTIRSLRLKGGEAVVRTGAGLVGASDAAAEWQECFSKARQALSALGSEVRPDDAR